MIYVIFGYIYLMIHRPMEIWQGFESLRPELLYVSLMSLVWMMAPKRIDLDRLEMAIVAIATAVFAAWALSPWAEHGSIAVKNYSLVLIFSVILISAVRDERQLHQVLIAFMCVMALYMMHSLWEYRNGRHVYRMGISRLIGVDTSLNDPNSFGNSIVYSLPFLHYFWMSGWNKGWLRMLIGVYGLLSFACIGLTGSRSSFVGLVLWGLVTILMTAKRRVITIGAVCMLAVGAFVILPEELQTRFTTIVDPSVGPANAQESGQGRIDGFFIGLNLWQKFPLTGAGPGSWLPASGRKIESHNLYGQLVGELGTLGLFAFVFMLTAIVTGVRRLTKKIRAEVADPKSEPLYHLARAIGLSTFLLLFEGMFGHNLYRYNYVWYCAFLLIAWRAYRSRQTLGQVDEPSAEGAWALAT